MASKKASTATIVAAEMQTAHKCSLNSWAGRGGSKDISAPTVRYAPKNSAVAKEQKSLLALLANASGEHRYYVKLAGAQHCTMPNKVSLYDMGVLTRFRHAILPGDVTTDCGGPVVHASVNRGDLPLEHTSHTARKNFRLAMSSDKYASDTNSATSTRQHFKFGFMMTYVRDTNYQMYMVDCVSRWWCDNLLACALVTYLIWLLGGCFDLVACVLGSC